MPAQKTFFLTTPIYYVNARPHIGHAYTTIVADVLARRHRLLGEDVFFLTGTDEHGQKIERSAAKAGIPPQHFADEVSASFETLWQRMGITQTKFIRTTDPAHQRGVQKLFADLYARGHIYLASYTGAYCVSDEAFVDAPVGTPCPDCGRLLEEVTEENFFFRLSAFQLPLLDLIESNRLKIENESRRNEVLSFLRGNVAERIRQKQEAFAPNAGPVPSFVDSMLLGQTFAELPQTAAGTPYIPGALKDLSVSRSSFTWGIPVPEPAASAAKDKHVIYVWLDALANYMTAVGYGSDAPADIAQFEKYWPADLHLVGKEIIRFHCVYWPAFLLAAGLLPPKAITAHGWLLFDNSKMSKSKGNVVRTETILEAFGALSPPPPSAPATPQTADAANTPPTDGRSRGLQPAETDTAHAGALALEPSAQDRDLFAADILRYFLLREIPFGQDGSFSFEAMVTRYNADLANGYGNLVSRTLNLLEQNFSAGIEQPREPWTCEDRQAGFEDEAPETVREAFSGTASIIREITQLHSDFAFSISNARFHSAIIEINDRVSLIDGYISWHKPWLLAKNATSAPHRAKLAEVLYTAAESIRIITALLHPILPYATARVWTQLGLGDIEAAAANGELRNLTWGGLKPGTKLGSLGPIFPRADKGLAQIMADIEDRNAADLKSADRPDAPLKQASTPTHAAPVTDDPTHPAAPPRAVDAPEVAASALSVGGSSALTSGPDATPGHANAPASGIFGGEAAKMPAPSAPVIDNLITIDDFIKVELRVAEITIAERIPKADKLLRLEVSLGTALPPRQILSGIAEWYTPEDLLGRRIIVITNLAPRKMRGLESHGMLLAASEEGGKPFLATVPEGVPVGTRLK